MPKIITDFETTSMEEANHEYSNTTDHSTKSILARGCDPNLSANASKAIPPRIGNPEYVPTTTDVDFIQKLKSRKWSIIFFAPGACRFNASDRPIPGGSYQTEGWTLERYRELVCKLQGNEVQIVETQEERQTISLLKKALEKAKETN